MRRMMLAAGAAALAFGLVKAGMPVAGAEAGQTPRVQRGEASYYGPKFHGRKMANGKRFHPDSNSAAHKHLPLGTVARVTNLKNGRSAIVVVEDRGPFVRGRIIDVSPRVARQLDMKREGVVPVTVTPLSVPGQDGQVQSARR
jgi:rare lipoprotein A